MRYQKISVTAMISASVLMCAATAAFATAPTELEVKDISEYDSENLSGSEKIFPKLYKENYKIYEPYGLSYEKAGEYLIYDGKRVCYFMDEISPGYYRRFLTETTDGAVGVGVMRDEGGEIVSLTSVPIPQTSSEDIVTEDIPGNDLSISVTDDTVSIIGGADGPTSIFIAGKRGTFFSETEEDTGAKESQETN